MEERLYFIFMLNVNCTRTHILFLKNLHYILIMICWLKVLRVVFNLNAFEINLFSYKFKSELRCGLILRRGSLDPVSVFSQIHTAWHSLKGKLCSAVGMSRGDFSPFQSKWFLSFHLKSAHKSCYSP